MGGDQDISGVKCDVVELCVDMGVMSMSRSDGGSVHRDGGVCGVLEWCVGVEMGDVEV